MNLSNLLNFKGIYTISSVPEGAEAYVVAEVAKASKRPLLYIARDDMRMANLSEMLAYFSPDLTILTLPAWDCLPYDRVSPHTDIVSNRIETLCKLATETPKNPYILVTTVNSLMQRLPPREHLFDAIMQVKVGDKVEREALIHFLVNNGYSRSGTANEPGEFAVRGSIIDIVMHDNNKGLRLDFFGDTLEVIRTFDPLTQISGGQEQSLTLTPASEIIFNKKTIQQFGQRYCEMFGARPGEDPLYDAVIEGRKYPGMEHWTPLFYNKMETVFDYVESPVILYDHLVLEARHERFSLTQDYYQTRKEASVSLIQSGAPYHPLPPEMLYLSEEEWNKQAASAIQLTPFRLPEHNNITELPLKPAINFAAKATELQKTVFDVLKETIRAPKALNAKGQAKSLKYLISCYSAGSRDRLQNMLQEHQMHTMQIDSWQSYSSVSGKTIGLMVLPIERGFEGEDFVLLSEQDILGERIGRPRARKRAENFLSEAASLIEGELVVHKEHGIGRFEGLETLDVAGAKHDCLRIIYEGSDKLFVPVENIEVISRYGAEDGVKLDKLGGVSWQSRKARLKNRIKLAAEELLRIAAERAVKTAPVLVPLKGLYEEFCARFPYAETEDQLHSIEEITNDLASGIPMDRLICGDVGFGKTEVALRAAFIAACSEQDEHSVNNKGRYQVAVVTPTTLLCRQHYKTFKERFAGMPVRIRQLSRLVSSKEAAETRKLMAEGEVDIVVGTHALLAKNIQFKQLALLIVDEEQHFGVAQKERLKQLRSSIHVLTLSATPIPRTLQMSLTGIRELSIIATPPVDRLAVRTFVMPFDPVIVREAILREHYRGGKIFYVVPRINDLGDVHKQLKQLVPEVKIVEAHGQMPPQELDDIMNDFYDGKYDVLLSTTIVESGLDVPTANTMIIHRADMLGLAQLYQLRGRVGRGKIRAYAYLTVPPRRILTKTATQRLEVMQTLDSLGAGFSLASHDMDIRGFGNLVGEEQSGHIKEVGIELYQEMLKEAVESLKINGLEETPKEEIEHWSPQINIGLSVLIPEDYVPDLSLRLGLYRRISELTTEQDLESFAAEMIDRFGPLPEEAKHLLSIVRIKQLCRESGIEKVDAGPKGAVLTFRNNQFHKPEALIAYIAKNPHLAKLRADHKLVLMHEWENTEKRLRGLQKSLHTIVELAA